MWYFQKSHINSDTNWSYTCEIEVRNPLGVTGAGAEYIDRFKICVFNFVKQYVLQ